jgi:very-short-patch-repair endonuclease
MIAHSFRLGDDEICWAASLPVTNPARTAFDIGCSRTVDAAVPVLDALFGATDLDAPAVMKIADRWPGVRGRRRLQSTLRLVDGGAESPQESRLRVVLIRGGLPWPETQITFPRLRVRVDLGWREWKVAVEYDGVQHWSDARQRAWDIERIALLEGAGWAVVRVSAQMLARPEVVVERVRAKLRAAGCPI